MPAAAASAPAANWFFIQTEELIKPSVGLFVCALKCKG